MSYLLIPYCRVYSSLDNRELCNLETSVLVDEFKQNLHSQQVYEKPLEYILKMCPELQLYLKHNLCPCPGDWPCFLNLKKIVTQNQNSSLVSSFIPVQGPFHVCINVHEDVVLVNHFFFVELSQLVFGGT